ncbi:aminoglycoside resistance protein [Mycolicibacterium chubuense]|uniref:Aminoglycoside/hydroxyurea antibiotic resistance kinase n=1 Tax=Mycolicibacterium chubuense TaxID=1800 RepID=A0A0J6WKD5_MYCCU|nr:aminoglycoside phosphotransferase family protein [Mycolicibacterium chubuense]KMO83064.1 Aminoglycoside/hydroxyurea antibiotic resistance kinase [Mycolicibacterium chubuense]ORA48956.1 aminoglycoside resistance protein [Mycolicibacterium chubuense]SPY00725.1 streptomycin 6-kinase [Mycolicibacterium chubuense]
MTPAEPDPTALAQHRLEQWRLRADGPAERSGDALTLPVRTADGTPALLKIGASDSEHLVLRRWGGDGAVRLLRADPHERVLLTERVGPTTLDALTDTEACEIVAGLYSRLHVPALPRLPSATKALRRWADRLDDLDLSVPVPRRLIEQALALTRDLSADASEVVLHGDLQFSSVRAADREPWLAVDARPVNGDPHDELAPMLVHRWEDYAGHVRDGVRHRFWTLVDAAGLDDDRARAWIVVRMVRLATGASGANASAAVTRYLAIAKAVQD